MNLKEERGPFRGKRQWLGSIEDLPHEGWKTQASAICGALQEVQSVNVLFALQGLGFHLGRSGIFIHTSQEWQKEHIVSEK